MTDFLPGFLDEEPVVAAQTLAAPAPVPTTTFAGHDPERPRVDHVASFQTRVHLFTRSLSKARRAEVAGRPRFRNQPYLRRADEFDPDDQLP